MKSYMGKLLRVNLTTKEIKEDELNLDYAKDFIGGSGLGIRYAYDEIRPDTDPLSSENKIFFMTGPLTGTSLGTTGRIQVVFKSPLTGILCDCSSGGHWGAHLKKSGYDGLVIEGSSMSEVYLYINNDIVEIRDAKKYWGKDFYSTRDELISDIKDDSAKVLAIGQGGENRVIYAGLMNDDGRTAARGGGGAVMGSKNLKAIVVRGSSKVNLSKPDKYKEVALRINKRNATDPGLEDLRKYGTADVLDSRWVISDIPVKNWSLGSSEEMCVPLGGRSLLKLMPHRHNACFGCTIGCSRWVKIDHGKYKMNAPGPEYESIGALGTMCMINDIEAVSYANHLCNMYGIDTMSCGSTIAFAMECYEKELINKADTDGIDLTWGNKDALIQLIHKIGKNEGFGKLLGLGTRNLAKKIGGNSIEFAVQVKGLELPMHDARAGFAWASNYATGTRGGCHLHGMTDLYETSEDPIPQWGFVGKFTRLNNKGKAEMTRFAQNWAHILDSLVMCYFATVLLSPSDFCDLLNNATGQDISPADLLVIGDRINALHRSYNYLCGIRRKDDTLPLRAMTPLTNGGAAGKIPDLKGQLKKYYKLRDWENDGKPSYKSLVRLGLSDVADDLYKEVEI